MRKDLWKVFTNGLVFFVLVSMYSCQSAKEDKGDQNEVKTEPSEGKKEEKRRSIVFFGDSITAGYQLDLSEAFPALIQVRLDSLGIDYQCINAGLSGETTASGNSRVDWVLKNQVDIFVLELGANDGLRGISTAETRKNLQFIIDKVKSKYPDCQIVLAGMMIPPNMGQKYTTDFQAIFPELAKKNEIPLIPFLLDKVAGIPELNLDDGIHPTADGHKIVMENVWQVLSSLIK